MQLIHELKDLIPKSKSWEFVFCFFLRIDMILKFIWNAKNLNSQNNIEKNKVGRLTFPQFKTYHKATVIRVVCNGAKICTLIDGMNK